jgi:hypothetical protein
LSICTANKLNGMATVPDVGKPSQDRNILQKLYLHPFASELKMNDPEVLEIKWLSLKVSGIATSLWRSVCDAVFEAADPFDLTHDEPISQ